MSDVGATPARRLPRGIRNHNPGNLRESPGDRTQWVGERATDDDKSFEEFVSAVDGIRALAIVLRNYQRRHGLRTVEQIIGRWAPPTENDTAAYIAKVCKAGGWKRTTELDLATYAHAEPLVQAIIAHENGSPRAFGRGARWYAQEVIDAGLAAAGIVKPASRSKTVQTQTAQGVAAAGAGAALLLDTAKGAQGLVEPGTGVATALLVVIIVIAAWQVWRKVKGRQA